MIAVEERAMKQCMFLDNQFMTERLLQTAGQKHYCSDTAKIYRIYIYSIQYWKIRHLWKNKNKNNFYPYQIPNIKPCQAGEDES